MGKNRELHKVAVNRTGGEEMEISRDLNSEGGDTPRVTLGCDTQLSDHLPSLVTEWKE